MSARGATRDRSTRLSKRDAVTPSHLREVAAELPVMMTFAQVRDDVLRCSTRTLRNIIASGELRCVRRMQGARVLVPRSEILRWLAERST
jgi:excisionase family DNA binding protein